MTLIHKINARIVDNFAGGLETKDIRKQLDSLVSEDREYALKHLPNHMIKAGRFEQLYRWLSDFDFIEAKISALETQALIEDYDLAFNPDDLFSGEKAEALRLIQGAIRLSAHVLEKDKTQLTGQLLGRLMSFDVPGIKILLEQVKQKKNWSWLRPLNSNLTLPGGGLLRTLIGHTGAILTLGVTPDGKWVISGSSDNTIKIWNLKTGQEIFTLTGHTDKVNVVALTPDGKRLISGSSDKSIKIWNLETGEELFTLIGHTNEVNVIAVEPDGTWFVSGSNDTTLKMWELETGEEFFTLTGHTDSILTVAVSPDGSQVWSSSKDKTFKRWDLVTDEILSYSTKELVPYLTFTPDGKQRIVQIGDPRGYSILCISDLENLSKPKVLSNLIDEGSEMALNNILIKPDNYQQLIYSFLMSYDFYSGMLCMFDTKEQKFIFSFEAHTSEIKSLTITPDSKHLISGGNDKIIKLWNMEKIPNPIFISKTTHTGGVTKLIFTKYGNRLLSKSSGEDIKVWDWATEQLVFSLANEDTVSDLVVTLDDKWLIAAYLGYSISVWELSTGKEVFTFTDNNSWINTVAVTPDSKLLISGSDDGTIKVWNLETTEEVFTLIGHTDGISKVSVTSNGKRLISSSWDKTIKVWDLKTGQEILTFIAHASLPEPQVKIFGIITGRIAVTIDAVTPDSKLVISRYNCIESQEIIIWSVEDGKELFTFNGKFLAVTPDSKRVIFRLHPTTIKVYDLQLKEEIFTLEGHSDLVNNVTISSDSLWMYSWSKDSSIKVWNLDLGTEEFTLQGHTDGINSVALTPDNKRLISASSDHSLKVWDLATRKVIASFTGDDALTYCAVAPDGVTIAAGEASGRVHFLRLEGF